MGSQMNMDEDGLTNEVPDGKYGFTAERSLVPSKKMSRRVDR